MSCQAKTPLAFIGGPLFVLCGEPSTEVYDYWCGCGRHSRRGETCDAHRPVEGDVGCVRCFTELGAESHECPMLFRPAEDAPPVVVEAPGGVDVCDLCGMPAVRRGAGWAHAEIADEVFCALLFPRARGVGSGGSE